MSVLDLRYENCRMKDPRLEGRLLSSIAERGIEQPLEGVAVKKGGHGVLLNGFKRYRCALKLGKATVPYTSLGGDEVMGILNLLRPANTKALNILEEARFIDEFACRDVLPGRPWRPARSSRRNRGSSLRAMNRQGYQKGRGGKSRGNCQCLRFFLRRSLILKWSGWPDLNRRPHAPQACALPS